MGISKVVMHSAVNREIPWFDPKIPRIKTAAFFKGDGRDCSQAMKNSADQSLLHSN